MRQVVASLLGAPADRQRALSASLDERSPVAAIDFLLQGVMHNTLKAGALLTAQGMFAVVDTYAMDHEGPRILLLPAMILLLLGALLAMTVLRGTAGVFQPKAQKDEVIANMFGIVVSRMVRFNLALYMTFLSVVLLLVAVVLKAF